MSRPRRCWSAPTRLAWLLLALQASISGYGWAETLFQAPLFKVGNGPTSIATGDFNGDGRVDLAVANSQSNDISILIGHSDGTFAPDSRFPALTTPSSIGVADLNGDGKLDLVVANASTDVVSVLLGNGDGTFGSQACFSVGDAPASLAIGDLNRDGFPDIVTANKGSGDISTLMGNGDGTFRGQIRAAVQPRLFRVVLEDITNDGILDLAVADEGNPDPSHFVPSGISVFIGGQDGSLGLWGRIVGTGSTFTFGDFDRDGLLDLVIVGGSGSVRIYKGHGNSGFSFAKDLPGLTASFSAVAAADLDLDGNTDLALCGGAAGDVVIRMGNGDFTFRSPAFIRDGGSNPRDLIVGDLNGDGKKDLA